MKNLKIIAILAIFTMVSINWIYLLINSMKTSIQKNEEVVFWSLQMGTFDKYMTPLISEFEKMHPNIKIKWIDVPYAEGEKRTLASILSNTPPDLVNLTPDFSSVLAQKQALEFIDCSRLQGYNQQIVEILKYSGRCYAVPFYATSAITLYNKEIINKSQISQLPKTYDDIFKIANDVKIKSNAFVTMPTLTENDTFLKILNKYDINSAEKLSNNEAEKLLVEFKTLYNNDLIPKESITQNHQEALEKYMSGQLALIQSGANFLNIVKENAPQVFSQTDVLQQLVGSNDKYDVSVMNLVIPARAKHKEAALEFALFLTNKKNQVELAKLTTILPVNSEALDDNYFVRYDENDIISKARYISAKQLKNLQIPVKFQKNQKERITLLNTTVQKIVLGEVPVRQGLKECKMLWMSMEQN